MLMFHRVANSEHAVSEHRFFESMNAISLIFCSSKLDSYVASNQSLLIDILHVDVVIDSDDKTLLIHTPLSTSNQGVERENFWIAETTEITR